MNLLHVGNSTQQRQQQRVLCHEMKVLVSLGTGQKLEGGGGETWAGANMGRAMVFHASTKGRAKQFGACH